MRRQLLYMGIHLGARITPGRPSFLYESLRPTGEHRRNKVLGHYRRYIMRPVEYERVFSPTYGDAEDI